ncbi:MAG: hypothetical protein VR72_21595 [Clostridiaceae bacterium BRH_c20a]|nr:MAG: hypothetical protein VR72_21595 [Clostridiaceae bacterium BRH_c20a]
MKKYVLKIRPGHLPNFSSSGSYVFWESITKLPIIFISIVAVCLCISTTSLKIPFNLREWNEDNNYLRNKDFFDYLRFIKIQLIFLIGLLLLSFGGYLSNFYLSSDINLLYFCVKTIALFSFSAIAGLLSYFILPGILSHLLTFIIIILGSILIY